MKEGKKTIVVAMSGGVDSSVAAALLLEQGHTVIGMTMKTYDYDEVGGAPVNESSCCGLDAVNDARLVAAHLGIPHYVVDFREEFGRRVIDYFTGEYLQGRTPNPCVMCNRDIKWGALLRKAEALGADALATGHYARILHNRELDRYSVCRGVYAEKDQSYALWALMQEALAKTLFPLGEMTKPEVREHALRFKLRTAAKAESFEICFVADNDYTRFLREREPGLEQKVAEGPIVWDGKVVGHHRGYPFYTVGQRKGIGAFGEKVYVVGVDSRTNTVTIGRDADLHRSDLRAHSAVWGSHGPLPAGTKVTAKVRYKDVDEPAVILRSDAQGFDLRFDSPKRAITPGQSAVVYLGDEVAGGGIIDGADVPGPSA